MTAYALTYFSKGYILPVRQFSLDLFPIWLCKLYMSINHNFLQWASQNTTKES